MVALALLLGGCSAQPSINPIDWWHSLEGGAIAQTRPPPPNADAPYPTLASMPPKPKPPNAAALQTVAGALASDRASARYAATAAPIPTLPPPAARPTPAPAPAPAQADDEQPSASLQAANAPPPPKATPPAATAPGPASTPAPSPATASAALAAPVTMPDIPSAPPPPPSIPGVSVPAHTAPTLPPVAPPPKPVPPGPPGPPVAVPFPVGSAVLRPAAQAPLKSLAAQRGARSIAITGLGEATHDDPAAQAAALPLALDRARAVAAALGALGVPATALHILALPSGGGAVARLVD